MNSVWFIVTLLFLNIHEAFSDPGKILPIDFDLYKITPDHVVTSGHLGSNLVSSFVPVPDQKNVKIGNVFANGVLIYPDSENLIERSVSSLYKPGDTMVQINSVYFEDGMPRGEIVQFRSSDNRNYTRLVRLPLVLNLMKEELRTDFIKADKDDNSLQISFTVKEEYINDYVIGLVKYGNVIIDHFDETDINKTVITYAHEGKVVIQITKITKNSKNIVIKRQLILEPGNYGYYKEIERTETAFY